MLDLLIVISDDVIVSITLSCLHDCFRYLFILTTLALILFVC